jgi:hypothetical protein
MNQHARPPAHINPTAASARPDAEVVDELMDHVAALLQSQMQTANRQLRKRAARLLDPARTNASTRAALSHDERSSRADRRG